MADDCQSTSEAKCDKDLPVYMQIMYIYLLSVLLVFGTLGNLISLFVFVKQRNEKSSRTIALLICLTVADSLYLLSSIFTRLLPTISTYVYIGEKLSWAIYARPYATTVSSMLQTFASYMLLLVTIQRFILVTKPITFTLYLSHERLLYIILGIILFSIGLNFIRFFELEVEVVCSDCLGAVLPLQTRTDLGMNIYFNIFYTIILRIIFRGLIPVITVSVLTRKISVVSKIPYGLILLAYSYFFWKSLCSWRG